MEVKWLGHAAFLIKGMDGFKIITDPYRPGAYGGGIAYGPIKEEANIVTVSHDHDDHNWVSDIKGSPVVLKGPGVHEVHGRIFKGIATFHDPYGGKERGKNTVFCFTVDGIKICHLGDLGHVLSDEQLREIGEVDLLFIPVGGYYTIDAQEATKVLAQINPKKAIPMHFKNPKCGFPISPVEDFLKDKEGVRRMGSSVISFVPQDFKGEGPEIVVLEPAL